MKHFPLIILVLFFSCSDDNISSSKSIHSYIDNEIAGEPVIIEIFQKEKPSIKIESSFLHMHNSGNTILFGGVHADLFNKEGVKVSEMYSDSAIIFNNSDSVKAFGIKDSLEIRSEKGYILKTKEIILYNDSKLVKSNEPVVFISNNGDEITGKGFWSNFDMSNFQILKVRGEVINTK